MKINKPRKSRSLVYWHSEGLVNTDSNGNCRFFTNSANLIDFMVTVAEQTEKATISGPKISARKNPILINHKSTTNVLIGKLNLSTRSTSITSIPAFVSDLFVGPFGQALRTSDISVSVGLSGTGTLVGLIRVLLYSKPHAFIVRGDRMKTVDGSSRSTASKMFAKFRILIYAWWMHRLTAMQKTEIWFQGGAHHEEILSAMPAKAKHRLKVLNAVLRSLPEPIQSKKIYDLIFVGRITQEKGLVELLEAVSFAKNQGTQLSLCIVGKGPDESLIRSIAVKHDLLDQIFWKGFVSEPIQIIKLLSQSRIFVLPSYTEGLPRSILEAMWAGIPCVVTPVGGIPYLFKNGESIFFVPTHDAEKLATRLIEVHQLEATNNLTNLIQRARKIAYSCKFDEKANVFIAQACLPAP